MHVFPFHALNKNLGKVIKARENSHSRSLFDIFYQSDGNKNEFASN